jgi:hypothetical protein
MNELKMDVEKAICQDELIQLVEGEDIEDYVSDSLNKNWILKKGIGELSIPNPPDNWDPDNANEKAQGRGALS